MEDNRKSFHFECPQGHAVRPLVNPVTFKAELAAGYGEFYCLRCGHNWPFPVDKMSTLSDWADRMIAGGKSD